jgi:hypothetical protein
MEEPFMPHAALALGSKSVAYYLRQASIAPTFKACRQNNIIII